MNSNVMSELSKNYLGTGDISLRIATTKANQSFRLFYQIATEEGGFVCVDWGDGNKETFMGTTTYSPLHVYAAKGEYIVKLTGSKFTKVEGPEGHLYNEFQVAVKEILSLKMPTDSTNVSLRYAFRDCTNLTGSIPAWDNCIVDAYSTYQGCTGLTGNIPEWGTNITNVYCTYYGCEGLTGNIPAWGPKIVDAGYAYYNCTGLTGGIPEWSANIASAYATYKGCTSLTGNIPEWGTKITNASSTYWGCTGLTGSVPEWSANITSAYFTYSGCTGLTGEIPEWGANITHVYCTYWCCIGLTGNIPKWGANIINAGATYWGCSGLTGCSKELIQDPMPSRIISHDHCVSNCAAKIRRRFTKDWGGSKRKPKSPKN